VAIDFPGGVEDYEGAADEDAISSANSDYDIITGSPVFDSAEAMRGSFSGRYASAGAITSTGKTFTARAEIYDRVYFKINGSPAAAMYFMGCNSSGTIRAQNRINADRTITVRNGTTAVYTFSTVCATGTWYRVERHINLTAGTQETRLFLGHDTTAIETSGSVAAPSALTADRVAYGNLTAVTGTTIWIDDATSNNGAGGDTWPGPSLVTTPKSGSDTFTLTEGTPALSQSYTGTDTLTVSDNAALTSTTELAASDSITVSEVSADTEIEDQADVHTLTDTVTALTAAVGATELLTQGDNLVNSIQTGQGCVVWGGAIFLNQVVVAEVDAAAWSIGDPFLVYVGASDAIAETKVFRIASKGSPFAGFVNMFADQNFDITTAPDTGDWIREIVPVGAFLDISTTLADSATQNEDATLLTGELSRTDSLSVTDTGLLTELYSGTDTFTLSDSSSMVPATAASDSITQSEGTTAITADPSRTDAITVSEQATVLQVSLSRTDTLSQTEGAVVLGRTSSGTDSMVVSEAASLQEFRDISVTDTLTQTEGATVLARSSSASDSWALSEAASSTAAVSDVDSWEVSETSGLNAGGDIASSETFTVSEEASAEVEATTSDDFTMSDASSLEEQYGASDDALLVELSAIEAIVSAEDAFTISDLAEIDRTDHVAGSDSFGFSDAAPADVSVVFGGTDGFFVSEPATTLHVEISAGDTMVVTETPLATAELSASDSWQLFEDSLVRDSILDYLAEVGITFPNLNPEAGITFPGGS
jgi:hypothetical protein